MLYDVESDRVEALDLALDHPEVLKDLVSAYQVWADAVGVVENPPKPQKH
jgi:hypothetical protein